MQTKQILGLALSVAALASCGQASTETVKTDTMVVTDTVTKTELVTVPTPIDSATVFAYYAKVHKGAKNDHTPAHKTVKGKKVVIDSYAPVEHHDVEFTATPAPAAGGQSAPAEVKIKDDQNYYFRPDEPASFPGGEKAFDEYLNKNLEYPEKAMDNRVEGTVYALAFLDEKGKVEKVEFPGDQIKYGFQMEARKVLMASPNWNPAKHAGAPVKSKFAIPIVYQLK